MKIKNLLGSLIAGTAMLAIASASFASTVEVNIYGASAQFTFWKAVAPNWINSLSQCSSATVTSKIFDGNNAVSFANCSDGNEYIVRVSSKASYDAIYSLEGNDSLANFGSTAEGCAAGDPGDPGSSLEPYYRKMVDETSCSGTTCSALKCVRVTIGASDVAAASFTQGSQGQQYWNSGSQITRAFSGIPTNTPNALSVKNPFVVPFAFYVNTSNATLNSALNGNLTRSMAVLLFSGQITDWSQFGSSFPTNVPVVLCMRHAGSGTHATLDYAVMEGNGWGASPVSAENAASIDGANYDNTMPTIYFNDSTGTEQSCINSNAGAIGYYDADKASSTTHLVSGQGSTIQLAYQGVYPSATAVAYGIYDFWTIENAYYNPTRLTTDGLTSFVTGTNGVLPYVSGNIPSTETAFWVDTNPNSTQTHLIVSKTSDQSYIQE